MKYTKEELYDFDIYSLRYLGRNIGVKAPTSLKKAELIENILSVQNGKIPPYTTKRGRPVLHKKLSPLEEIEQIIQRIIKDNEEKIKQELRESAKLLLEEVKNYNPDKYTKK